MVNALDSLVNQPLEILVEMNRTTALATILVGCLMAACASQPEMSGSTDGPQASASEAPDSEQLEEIKQNAEQVSLARVPRGTDVVCERVVPTGSFIPERRCQTRTAMREETEAAQEWLRSDGTNGAISEVR